METSVGFSPAVFRCEGREREVKQEQQVDEKLEADLVLRLTLLHALILSHLVCIKSAFLLHSSLKLGGGSWRRRQESLT